MYFQKWDLSRFYFIRKFFPNSTQPWSNQHDWVEEITFPDQTYQTNNQQKFYTKNWVITTLGNLFYKVVAAFWRLATRDSLWRGLDKFPEISDIIYNALMHWTGHARLGKYICWASRTCRGTQTLMRKYKRDIVDWFMFYVSGQQTGGEERTAGM